MKKITALLGQEVFCVHFSGTAQVYYFGRLCEEEEEQKLGMLELNISIKFFLASCKSCGEGSSFHARLAARSPPLFVFTPASSTPVFQVSYGIPLHSCNGALQNPEEPLGQCTCPRELWRNNMGGSDVYGWWMPQRVDFKGKERGLLHCVLERVILSVWYFWTLRVPGSQYWLAGQMRVFENASQSGRNCKSPLYIVTAAFGQSYFHSTGFKIQFLEFCLCANLKSFRRKKVSHFVCHF